MDAGAGRQLLLYLLSVGLRGKQGQRLRTGIDGILSGRRPGQKESPACACWARKTKGNGFQTRPCQKIHGFQTVDTAPNGYELLALSFDGTKPRFAPHAKKQQIENKELTVFYDMQCPYILQRVERVERYCGANGVPLSLVRVDTLQKAKELPCVFNNWAVFYKGKFETVNLLDDAALQSF